MNDSVNMRWEDQILSFEKVGTDNIRIRLHDGVDPNQVTPQLLFFFEKQFQDGVDQIHFNMENILFPNGSFIAMLIGMTTEARRRGGDFKILNLQETAKNHLSTFTPLTYLSIGPDLDLFAEEMESVSQIFIDELEFEEYNPVSIQVEARADSLQRVTDFVTQLARKVNMDPTDVSKLKIAVYEACMNVIEHGYAFQPGKSFRIEVVRENDFFKVSIIDHAEPFDFFGIKSYNVTESFEHRARGGYGTYIIRHAVDDVAYISDPGEGNRLTLIKRIVPRVKEDLKLDL